MSLTAECAGKTVACINELLTRALASKKQNAQFAYIAPFFVQAKQIAWEYLKTYGEQVIVKSNESELYVEAINRSGSKSKIFLFGADNPNRLRGLYLDGVVIDEPADIAPSFFNIIVRPMLADRKGWCVWIGTPKGHNEFYQIYQKAKASDDWFCLRLKASDSGLLDVTELAALKRDMSEDQYQQEMETSFDAAIVGAIYGRYMREAEDAGRITDFEYHDALPVSTSWDLGFDDATAIWFFQLAPGEIWLVDYYENNGQDIGHYLDYLKSKPYRYHHHYVPHDAGHKTMAAGGRSIIDQAYEQGVKMQMISATTQQNSIEAARKTIPRCWFDEVNCKPGIEALKNYCFKFDEERKIFSTKPHHDWSSHGSDAFEIMARVWQEKVTTNVDLARRDVERAFHTNRRIAKLNQQDPYRTSYGAKKAKRK